MSLENFSQIKSDPEDLDLENDPTMEEWWDLLLKMQAALEGDKKEYAELQTMIASNQKRLIEHRTETDAIEARYLKQYEDDEQALEIVRGAVKAMRDDDAMLETFIAKLLEIKTSFVENNAKMQESAAELHEELKRKRH